MTSTPAINTAALKEFATKSRTQLLDQMRVRIGQVLADSRTELEHPTAVALLKKAVTDRSIEAVTEEAAYTWFNRLTAARYMDVNGFSGMYRVVSPAEGSASALPEVLAQARAGNFDSNVGDEARQSVSDLLAGQRQSDNPDFEAYAILLRTVFHTWHSVLPSVFPASVDWVELLIPIDMLTPTAVRALAVEVMDTVTCTDVEVVGWLYQFYISDRKDQINDSKVKITAAEIGPVTQLFTPHWIVRYLVENSLGRLWLRSKPKSELRSSMEYYVEPVEGQADDGVKVTGPEEIRLIDPACGSGHMLTYAFDLLYAIYEEEGYAPSDISRLILTHNLVGTEIDPRAAQLASFALTMKARGRDRRFFTRDIQPRIVLIEPLQFSNDDIDAIVTRFETTNSADGVDAGRIELLLRVFENADMTGALIQVDADAVSALSHCVEVLGTGPNAIFTSHLEEPVRTLLHRASTLVDKQYHVVVANPPYLGSGNMGSALGEFSKANYPDSKSDTCVMFIERSRDLITFGGSIAMVTMHSWMFLKSYARLRAGIPRWGFINSMAHLGTRGFDQIGGEVVQTTAFVIDKIPEKSHLGLYFRL
ncbi:BREX-1 system adenine-specific DNA-methyltransferase PglX [Rhodococcus erythropolis]|nr:BREX-1 system adenine-specific DNA-methyltransferase PglX [Rhodococcus erythropolis]MBT2268265.1 BREX-1 system adenine-specific DNA-methyltransferase PglX [Rhodococcus erythropolis]